MLELHVWGPGYGLPSIDPRCLATIAFFEYVLPRDAWTVVPSSNSLLSPTKELPAIRDGTTWIAGFRGIIEYVRQSLGIADIDAVMDEKERAECIAFSAFIETHGQELIDLSLYVSRPNYESTTRPLFSALLPWPTQYYTPSRLRAAAIARTADLNITSLDFSTTPPVQEPTGPPPPTPRTSILTSAPTVAAFKLTSLSRSFLSPLQSRLGPNRYFFGDTPTTLDFLALGYLALCLYPEDLPHPFLASIMRAEYPRLCAYVHELRQRTLGPPIADVSGILGITEVPSAGIPWAPIERGDLPWITGLIVQRALEAVPFTTAASMSRMRKKAAEERAEEEMDPEDLVRKRKIEGLTRREKVKSVLFVVGGVAAFVGYVFWTGLISISFVGDEAEEVVEEEEGEEGTGKFGLAGDILGLRNVTGEFEEEGQEEISEDVEDVEVEEMGEDHEEEDEDEEV
ncbi:hypothetical protein RUND412_006833 [Rhizina undulata]